MTTCHVFLALLLGLVSATVPSTETARYNCMSRWLRVSGASESVAADIESGGQILDARMDEAKVNVSREYFLTLLLNFNPTLAKQLKKCTARSHQCPNSSNPTISPCSNAGPCFLNETVPEFQCRCQVGLRGSRCEIDVDECAAGLHNCSTHPMAACVNRFGYYDCECPEGYIDVDGGRVCMDVDECIDGSHDCSHGNAICNNTDGSFTCTCSKGYQGDGRRCTESVCDGSLDKVLCKRMDTLEKANTELREKLAERDVQIQRQYHNLQFIATLMTGQQRKLQDMSVRIDDVKKKQCTGILWTKSFAKTGQRVNSASAGPHSAFQVTFLKKRNDTRLRVFYSSSLGRSFSTRGPWVCFHISILFNGSQCAHPAPIRSAGVGYPSGGSAYHTQNPTTISGTCEIAGAGPVALSVQLSREGTCKGTIFDNYAPTGSSLTATMHVDEICPEEV